jgi:hypothetical protein
MSKANGTLVGAKNDFTSLKGRTLATVVAPLQGANVLLPTSQGFRFAARWA